MRLFPAVKPDFWMIGILLVVSPAVAQMPAQQAAPQYGQKAIDQSAYLQAMQQNMQAQQMQSAQQMQQMQQQGYNPGALWTGTMQPKPPEVNLGSADDPNSARYKSNHLAKKARQQRNAEASLNPRDDVSLGAPPPEVEALQQVNETRGDMGASIADDPVNKEISLDMRRDAQREAAISYGARGGLAKRNYQIMERMRGFDPVLDKVFDFRSLLIKAPSGLLIEPPIVKEAVNALLITEGGNEAAVADEVYGINKQAKIVAAPRDWRQYLIQSWSDVPPPPRVLWPKTPQEQASWNGWVAQGWEAGIDQAEQIFESNTNRLTADYSGMVRYRMLLAQGMISKPYAMHEDRGVTGDKNQMRVGDRALRITGPSQFLTGADLWKPADR